MVTRRAFRVIELPFSSSLVTTPEPFVGNSVDVVSNKLHCHTAFVQVTVISGYLPPTSYGVTDWPGSRLHSFARHIISPTLINPIRVYVTSEIPAISLKAKGLCPSRAQGVSPTFRAALVQAGRYPSTCACYPHVRHVAGVHAHPEIRF